MTRALTRDDITNDDGEFVCEQCNRSFGSVQGLGHHLSRDIKGDYRRPPCPQCRTCLDLKDDKIAYQLHRLEDHHLPLTRLRGLMPGEFEAAAEQADSVFDLAQDLGKSIEWVIAAREFYADRREREAENDTEPSPEQTGGVTTTWAEVGDD